jgi:hypothetical protein
MADYAWVIDKDHLVHPGSVCPDEAGVTGPRSAPDNLLARLTNGEGHAFQMYDDDRELYYSGRLVTTGDMGDEEHCAAPLFDFGLPNAGCTEVHWTGHKEWDCEG